jgi:hypothetical protein
VLIGLLGLEILLVTTNYGKISLMTSMTHALLTSCPIRTEEPPPSRKG